MSRARRKCDGRRDALLSLPVVSPGKPRKSRMSVRRAVVLILVNLVMAAHIIQWLMMGKTLGPLEPSESMETVKHGVVTVGFILFFLALASTWVFGRFFCGWGCHVLALQDLCTWLLGKCGLRPHAFRSRLLLWLPLLLALYMFAWPLVYRFAIAPFTRPDLELPGITFRLIVTDYWKTFPSIAVAIPFLLICTFGVVYLLGSKGYCTYGCPYGGFFAPLDKYSSGRIRVTADCEQCGHCTATCTSNVRVHEEVRDFGMVVDPGCMKCLDCVSVCPKDALYFGFGPSAVAGTSAEVGATSAGAAGVSRPASASSSGSRWDLTWGEEIALSAAGAITFFSVRGAYGAIPLLFASGIVICAVYLLWKAWRTYVDASVSMHLLALKRSGRVTAGGWVVRSIVALGIIMVLHTGSVNAIHGLAAQADDKVLVLESSVFTPDGFIPDAAMQEEARRAVRLYQLESDWSRGGIGIVSAVQPQLDMRIAWLHSVLREFVEAEAVLRANWEADPGNEAFALAVGRVLMADADSSRADVWYSTVLGAHPQMLRVHDEYISFLIGEEKASAAIAQARLAVAGSSGQFDRDPDALNALRRLSLVLIEQGTSALEWREGVDLVQQTLEIAPENAYGWRALALGWARLEDFSAAETALARAIDLAPADPRLRRGHADLLQALGRSAEAERQLEAAARLESAERAPENP